MSEQQVTIDEVLELMAATFCVRDNIIAPYHYGPIKEQLYSEALGWGFLGFKVGK